LPGGGETGVTHSISGHADLENAGGLRPNNLLKTYGREAPLDELARRMVVPLMGMVENMDYCT